MEIVKFKENTYLKLESYSEDISLVLCYENGRQRHAPFILKLKKDGKFSRYAGVNSSSGICLDKDRKIILSLS